MVEITEVETPEIPEPPKRELAIETHLFTTLRYKDTADSGFSGNLALLIEAMQHSEKVLDNDLKILAKGIFDCVIKHKVVKHTQEEVEKAMKEMKEKTNETVEK